MNKKEGRPIVAMFALLIGSFVLYIISAVFYTLGGGSAVVESKTLQDQNTASTFGKISLGLRIMPSHKTEGNKLVMIEKEGIDAEWQGDYDGDFADTITDAFFTTDSLEDYFPDMLFTQNTVPIGNAKPFCLHLDWATKENKKVMDKYYAI